ncbi:MAG: PEGA domain-containing protein, partial [Myxococcales bacterium]|nr:PEGA domain-containing protein [Myxococcales bacterium]
ITADPYANIRVDGRDWGTTPVYNRRLAAGPHEIVLVSPDDGTVRLRRTVTIQSGALTKVSLP